MHKKDALNASTKIFYRFQIRLLSKHTLSKLQIILNKLNVFHKFRMSLYHLSFVSPWICDRTNAYYSFEF